CTQLMICTPATYQPVQSSTHVCFAQLAHEGPIAPFQEYMAVQRTAFGHDPTDAVGEAEAQQFRARFTTTQFFAAWLMDQSHTAQKELSPTARAQAGEPAAAMVSVASLLPPHDGITEIAGIATAKPYRRQGVAGALTASVVAQAFAQGLTAVFLTAADAAAGRVYERVGFRAIGTGMAYYLPT
ncbi:MAG: GNAT family N-acetyltransferase, partial [Caldilineaceae bacterium]|nr:GNAT family N-acetyltransferase [Caldilineaceae bacterium]